MAKKQGLNWQALILEEAQTKIKLTIRDSVLKGESFVKLDKDINKLVNDTVGELESDRLKVEAKNGLLLFAEKVYKKFVSDLGFNYSAIVQAVNNLGGNIVSKEQLIEKMGTYYEIGLPNQEYQKDYMKRVKVALENMRQLEAKSYSSHVSLRNVAEMQVRYEQHEEKLNTLRDKGDNLVVCSTHGNCSKRCQPWQGKYYTLDKSTRVVNGIEFIPLETATDVYVTTNRGKTYKNGLLGFNCRHEIIPYTKGLEVPHVSDKIISKEREIDHRMRQLERNVRQWKEERDLNNGVDRQRYLYARKKAIEWNKKYIEFAQKNERAYYPDRVKII